MSENVGEIVYTVDADTRPFLQKMDETTGRLSDFEKASDKTTKAAKDLSEGTKEAAKSADTMGSSMEQAAKKVDGATDSMRQQGKAAETAEEAIARIAATVKQAAPAVQDLERATSAQTSGMIRATAAQEAAALAASKASQATKEAATGADTLGRSSDTLSNKMGAVRKVTEEEARAITELMGRIDPASVKIRAMDKDIDELSKRFNDGQISVKQYTDAMEKAEKKMASYEAQAKGAGDGTSKFAFALAPLAAAMAAMKVGQMGLEYAKLGMEFTQLQSRIQRLTESTGQAANTYQSLLSISSKTGVSLKDTAKLWESLTGTLKEFGQSNGDVLALVDTLQKMGRIGGSSTTEMSNSLRQLGQSFSGGIVRAQEFNSVIENTPEIGRRIAKGMDLTMSQLRARMLEGKLTAEDALGAIKRESESVNAEFAKLPVTVEMASNAIETAMGAAVSEIDKATKASAALVWAMQNVAKGINSLSGNMAPEVKLNKLMTDRIEIQNALTKAQNNWLGGGPMATEYAKQLKKIDAEILAIQEAKVSEQKKENQLAKEREAEKNDPNRTTAGGEKVLAEQKKQLELLRVEGLERKKLRARQALGADATAKEIERANEMATEAFNLETAQAAKKKDLRAEESQQKKDLAKAERERVAAEKEATRHTEENKKAITEMAAALSLAGLKGKELAVAQAMLKLNKWATPEDRANVERLTEAMYKLEEAKANKALAGKVDPLVGEQQRFATELEELKKANDAKLVENDRYLELKGAAEYQHSLTMQKLQEADFARQSFTNKFLMDGINAMASATTQTLSGLISGTMNAKQAMAGFANVILNQAIGAVVELGFAQVKQAIMGQVAQRAAGAAYATTVAAQVQATSFLAAQAAFASTAAIPVVGPGLAPAAASAAMATAQGIGAPAIALSAASGRFNGGTVDGGSMYRVNEGGGPEVFNAANGSQYMIPGQRGEVVSSKNAGGGSITNHIIIQIDSAGNSNSSGDGSEDSKMMADTLAAAVVNEMNNQLRPGGILWEMQNG